MAARHIRTMTTAHAANTARHRVLSDAEAARRKAESEAAVARVLTEPGDDAGELRSA